MTNGKMITSNTYGDYFFQADFSHEILMTIAGKQYWGSFQTGHSYDYNDYSMPSNTVSAYDDGGVLECLDSSCGDLDAFISSTSLDITKNEFDRVYAELSAIRDEAQLIVNQLIAEDEAEIEADTRVYIIITPLEIGENGVKTQCDEQYSETLCDRFDAEVAVETERENGNLARICTKAEAYEVNNK